jgi:hypothetical protein
MSSNAYLESVKAIEDNLEKCKKWEAEYTCKLSQCDDGQREKWERSRSIIVAMKEKRLIDLQRIKEERVVLSFMFPALC